jgi:Flagellar assembly protein T, C-terminal domain
MVMRAKLTAFCVSILAGTAVSTAQTAPQAAGSSRPADYSNVYCSGFVSDPKIPDDIRVVSGEQSNYKITFDDGENIYINRGQDKGVKVGDRFAIVRPERDPGNEWFYGQKKLEKEMGTLYRDAGQVQVVNVQPKVSIAKVVCSPFQGCNHV